MTYRSEQTVYDQLGIENAGQIRSGKLLEFASLLNEVDPAVARVIIEQIPHFAGHALETFQDLARMVNQSNDDSVMECQSAYRSIIDTLSRQVDRPDISFEEKRFYLDRMMEAADRMAKKDRENKDHLGNILRVCATAVIGGVAAVLTVLGIKNARSRS